MLRKQEKVVIGVGNFQTLANKILLKRYRDVSSFATLRNETGNNALTNGNFEGNQASPCLQGSEQIKANLVETTEETRGKPRGLVLETLQYKTSLESFLAASALSSLLQLFFEHALEQGVDLLHDDKRWLRAICYGTPSNN